MRKVLLSVIFLCLIVCVVPSVFASGETGGISVKDTVVKDNEIFPCEIYAECGKGIKFMEFHLSIPNEFELMGYKANDKIEKYRILDKKDHNEYDLLFKTPDGEEFNSNEYVLKLYLRACEDAKDGIYEIKISGVRVYDKSETFFQPGNVSAKLILCIHSDIQTVNMGKCNHSFDDWTVTKQPTYNSEGTRVKKCVKCKNVCKTLPVPKIEKRNITQTNVKYNSKCTYTTKEVKPSVTLTYKGVTLKEKTDYTVSYTNNKSVGTGKIVISGKGGYQGKIQLKFTINPKKVTGLKAKKTTASKITLVWNKCEEADKYIIYIYKDKKWQQVGETQKCTFTVKKLSGGKKYKFKVRAVKGNYKGEFSSVLSAKTSSSK